MSQFSAPDVQLQIREWPTQHDLPGSACFAWGVAGVGPVEIPPLIGLTAFSLDEARTFPARAPVLLPDTDGTGVDDSFGLSFVVRLDDQEDYRGPRERAGGED